MKIGIVCYPTFYPFYTLSLASKICEVIQKHGTDIHLVGSDPSYKKITRREFGIDQPIKVIHNFVDTNRFSNRNNENLGKRYAENGEKIIAHVSNFRDVKRIPDLIKYSR
ncbi:MAG: hypothetical protein QME40_00865 [bacterium]|nr:hypothetical protein [bacterium]